jgi:hypothetical protein
MPKEGEMVQLSRPFQAILAALALFVVVWFFALHKRGSESSAGSSSASSNAQPAGGHTVHARASAGHTTTSAGHATVAAGHAKTATGHAKVAAGHAKVAAAHAKTPAGHAKVSSVHVTSTPHSGASASHTGASAGHAKSAQSTQHGSAAGATSTHAPAMQTAVAAELRQGKVALLLFWNPHSSDDSAVRREVQIVAGKLGRRVAVHTAAADQVGSFGSITRDIQVYQTPTLLIVNPRAQVTTVTGYTDAYALEQAIREARG